MTDSHFISSKNFVVFCIVVLNCFSCKPDINYQEMAADSCTCMHSLYEANNQFMEAQGKQQDSVMMHLIVQMDSLQKIAQKCMQQTQAKYASGKEIDPAKLQSLCNATCPNYQPLFESTLLFKE